MTLTDTTRTDSGLHPPCAWCGEPPDVSHDACVQALMCQAAALERSAQDEYARAIGEADRMRAAATALALGT